MIASITVPSVSGSTSTQTGVYVPAISTKIIEWSMRCSSARTPGRQRPR
jgi:hypothetical protein